MRFLGRRCAVLTACFALSAGRLWAQAPQSPPLVAYYGITGGVAHRGTTGTFSASELPHGAAQPESNTTGATLGLLAGIKPTPRVALIGLWDQLFAGTTNTGTWGTMTLHGAARVWLGYGIWAEVGGGASELGYKPPPHTAGSIARFWAPGLEAAAGMEVLRGRRVGVSLFARYSSATFNGLRVSSLSFQVGLAGTN